MKTAKARIADGYDRSAAQFSAFVDHPVYSFLAAPLAEALKDVDGMVLDLASGTGALGRQLPNAVAVDLSHGQLLHNPLALRVRADAERLPFGGGSFAAVGCAFGINHFPRPNIAVAEMARVAPIVGLITWVRPEPIPYAPKEAVSRAIENYAGTARTAAGRMVDRLSEKVGSEKAIHRLLTGAGLRADVSTVQVEVPWPGRSAFIDYRLSMLGASSLADGHLDAVRKDAAAAIARLSSDVLRWRALLILGLGTRKTL